VESPWLSGRDCGGCLDYVPYGTPLGMT
jgi:hypothetical protein